MLSYCDNKNIDKDEYLKTFELHFSTDYHMGFIFNYYDFNYKNIYEIADFIIYNDYFCYNNSDKKISMHIDYFDINNYYAINIDYKILAIYKPNNIDKDIILARITIVPDSSTTKDIKSSMEKVYKELISIIYKYSNESLRLFNLALKFGTEFFLNYDTISKSIDYHSRLLSENEKIFKLIS